MTKFFNKWTRIFHRWIAIPTIIIIPIAVITKFTGDTAGHLPPQLEQFQSILMLLLVISGTYLYLIPYIAKWQRGWRAKAKMADCGFQRNCTIQKLVPQRAKAELVQPQRTKSHCNCIKS